MKLKEFKVLGHELIERKVKHYKGTGSRISVPSSWKKVIIIKVE